MTDISHQVGRTELPEWLFNIRYLILSFRYSARQDICFSCFLGPEVRGSVGRQIKDETGCYADRDADCKICPEERRRGCIYHQFFEHGGHRQQRFALKLDPAWRGHRPCFQKGDGFGFDLVLTGKLISYVPEILDILSRTRLRLGETGVSPDLVDYGWRDENCSFISVRHLSNRLPVTGFSLTFSQNRAPVNSVTLHFLTPAEITLKHGRVLKNPQDLNFRLLLVRIMQRLRGLATEDADPDLPVHLNHRNQDALLAAASAITHSADRAHWQKVALRQAGKRRCGGLTGSITYRGDLTPFIPFLEAARILSLGKSPTLGLGQITFELDLH